MATFLSTRWVLLIGLVALTQHAAAIRLFVVAIRAQEPETITFCSDCNTLGLGEVNGEIVVYATPNSDPGELRAYSSDGSFIRIAEGNALVDFGEADGSFATASFEGIAGPVRLDYLNPNELFSASNPISGDFASVQGINSAGAFAGSFQGVAANAYIPTGTGAIFLPGPEAASGAADDINETQDVVVGFSNDAQLSLRPTVWRVDSNLSVTSSFILGTGSGNAFFVGDTAFDSAFTVLYEENGQDHFYLGSSQESGTFGPELSVITGVKSGFIVENSSTNECFLTSTNTPTQNSILLGSDCVDATQTDGPLYVLSGDGSVSSFAAVAFTSPDNAMLVSAALPSSRSVQVGNTATAFLTAINVSENEAENCGLISQTNGLGVDFFFQQTDPETNEPIGEPNVPMNIPAGGVQSFIFRLTPGETIAPMEIGFSVSCDNAPVPTSIEGLNTLLLSASDTPVADIVALAATVLNDGILRVDDTTGSGAFAVASVNVGSGSDLSVSVDTGAATVPINLVMCETDPATGVCINPTAPTSDPVNVTIDANETPTFAVFASSSDDIPLDPANSRVFVRFLDNAGVSRGATSVAVTRE